MSKRITSEELIRRYASERANACRDASIKLEWDIRRAIELLLMPLPDRSCSLQQPIKVWVETGSDNEMVGVDAIEVSLGAEMYIKSADDKLHLFWLLSTPSKLNILDGVMVEIYGKKDEHE